MQVNLVNNKEMLVFECIGVHDGAVCLAVSSLRHTRTGSRRSRGLSVVAIWNHVGKSFVQPLLFFKWLFFSGRASISLLRHVAAEDVLVDDLVEVVVDSVVVEEETGEDVTGHMLVERPLFVD